MENIQNEIEDKVIDAINFGVAGRLIITKPEKNEFKADIAIERRAKYKGEKEIYFQINSLIGPSKDDNAFLKDFPQDEFKTDRNFYLLFIYFDEIRQKLNDYIWLVPSVQFKDNAEIVKSSDGKKFLRFQVSLDIKNKNQYSKFIIKKDELGKNILSSLEKGGKFDFKEVDYGQTNQINLENLKDFIFTARQNTYAANANPVDNPRLLASKQLEFQKGDYFYRDIYFLGNRKFIGQEIVYIDSKPVWGMNYEGTNIGKLETVFLKEALYDLVDKCRIGGSCDYKRREFKYQDRGQGTVEEFSGKEDILLKEENIYSLFYRGGLI